MNVHLNDSTSIIHNRQITAVLIYCNAHITPHTHTCTHTTLLYIYTHHTTHITPHHITPHHTTHHTTSHHITSHIAPHTSYVAPHTLYVTPHIIRHTTHHTTPHTSHHTPYHTHSTHTTPHTTAAQGSLEGGGGSLICTADCQAE